jgi:glycosyltransferase involved in cell wall biosynthesis
MFKIGKPVVVSCRGSQINIAPTNPTRRAEVEGYFTALEQSTAIHCVSHAIRRVVEAHVDVGEKLRVIHPAVDPSFFSPVGSAGRTETPLQITTVGSLIWRKGYEYLLQAMSSLRDSGVRAHLRIIGDGPERERILFTLRDLELVHVVDLVGPLDEFKVREELRQADLFVLSSLSEGISNAVLEAMSCGLPVVVTDVGGMAEAIRTGVEGCLVPPRDPDAMAEAIAFLCTHRDERLKMGVAARDRVINHFNLDDHIDAWNRLLGSVVEDHGAAVTQ